MSDLATIGSSEAAIILKVSRWGSIWELWPRLVGLLPRYDDLDKPHLRAGHDVEQFLIPALYGRETGSSLVPGPELSEPPVIGPEPWMHARPDFNRAEDRRIVEAKMVRTWDAPGYWQAGEFVEGYDGLWGPEGSDCAPVDVLVQLTWQMVCQGDQDAAEIAAWNRTTCGFRLYGVPFRESLARSIVTTCRDWYEEYVAGNKPPPLDDTVACNRNLARLYPGEFGDGKPWRDPDASDIALARDLRRVRDKLSGLEAERRELESELKEAIGPHHYGIRDVAIWYPVKSRKPGGDVTRNLKNILPKEEDHET